MSWLSDADYEEEVRCAALGMEGPNAKSFRGESWADMADVMRKRKREEGEAESPPEAPVSIDPQEGSP